MIKYIDILLQDWWQWQDKLTTKGIGYPSDYSLDRTPTGKPASSIVPMVGIPDRLKGVDRAMRIIRPRLRLSLEMRYTTSISDKQRAKKLSMSEAGYRRQVDMAHEWLDGYLSR